MHTIVLIHGVINHGSNENWQDRAIRLFSGMPDVRVVVYKYGYVFPAFLGFGKGQCWSLNWCGVIDLEALVRDFVNFIEALGEISDEISVAAHSFGTTVFCEALKLIQNERQSIKFKKVLLAGSAYDPDFYWPSFRAIVETARHEYCPQDEDTIRWVPLGRFLRGSIPAVIGSSGVDGFNHFEGGGDSGTVQWVQEALVFTGESDPHSKFVTEEHILDNWFPFLLGLNFFAECHESLCSNHHLARFVGYYGPFIVRALGIANKLRGTPLSIRAQREAYYSIRAQGSRLFTKGMVDSPSLIINDALRAR